MRDYCIYCMASGFKTVKELLDHLDKCTENPENKNR